MTPDRTSVILLTESNLELSRKLRDAERTIDQKDKQIQTLEAALKRPSVALFTPEQLIALAALLYQEIFERMGIADSEKIN